MIVYLTRKLTISLYRYLIGSQQHEQYTPNTSNTVGPVLKDRPIVWLAIKILSLKTGGLWWQVHLYWTVRLPAKNWWSFKTGGPWQWFLKTGFNVDGMTLHCYTLRCQNITTPATPSHCVPCSALCKVIHQNLMLIPLGYYPEMYPAYPGQSPKTYTHCLHCPGFLG